MDLIQYKPEVLANELYEISKAYHESKVILSKYERDRKRYIAQEYLKKKALGKKGKDQPKPFLDQCYPMPSANRL